MNLYIRLMAILLRQASARPAAHLLDEVVTPMRVYPTDLDTNMHMNNGRYLTLMDLGRLDFLARVGLWWPSLARRWMAVLGASQMVHLKELRAFSSFELHTKLECWDERWFIIVQRFMRGDTLHAVGRVRGQCRGPQGLVTPETFLQLSPNAPTKSPPMSAATDLWLQSLRANRQEQEAGKA